MTPSPPRCASATSAPRTFSSTPTPLPIRLDVEEPLSVGADRIVNTLAAFRLFRRDTIAVDLGTATTFDCITADGVFLGGVIAPACAPAPKPSCAAPPSCPASTSNRPLRHRPPHRDVPAQRHLLRRRRRHRRHRPPHPAGVAAPRRPRRRHRRPRPRARTPLPHRHPRRAVPHPPRPRARLPPSPPALPRPRRLAVERPALSQRRCRDPERTPSGRPPRRHATRTVPAVAAAAPPHA
jgi:hypothetical protein